MTRQPGPFEVGAESRSISPQGLAAARFAGEHLPRDSRILVDGPNGLLLGSYGHLDPVIGTIRGIPVTRVFFSRTLRRRDRTVIVKDAIDYIVVDRRLIAPRCRSTATTTNATNRAPSSGPSRSAALRCGSSTRVPASTRIYDNGPIVIYDTSPVRRA